MYHIIGKIYGIELKLNGIKLTGRTLKIAFDKSLVKEVDGECDGEKVHDRKRYFVTFVFDVNTAGKIEVFKCEEKYIWDIEQIGKVIDKLSSSDIGKTVSICFEDAHAHKIKKFVITE